MAHLAKVPIAALLATPEQRRQNAADQRHFARERRIFAAMDRQEKRIKRQLAALRARLDLRRAAGKPVVYTSGENHRVQRLYGELNRLEERFNALVAKDDR